MFLWAGGVQDDFPGEGGCEQRFGRPSRLGVERSDRTPGMFRRLQCTRVSEEGRVAASSESHLPPSLLLPTRLVELWKGPREEDTQL